MCWRGDDKSFDLQKLWHLPVAWRPTAWANSEITQLNTVVSAEERDGGTQRLYHGVICHRGNAVVVTVWKGVAIVITGLKSEEQRVCASTRRREIQSYFRGHKCNTRTCVSMSRAVLMPLCRKQEIICPNLRRSLFPAATAENTITLQNKQQHCNFAELDI